MKTFSNLLITNRIEAAICLVCLGGYNGSKGKLGYSI